MDDTPQLVPTDVPHVPKATTIMVVAEHALVRAGLRTVLGETPGLTVIAEAESLARAVDAAVRQAPDVVLLDGPPADDDARAELSTLRRALPATCVLCLSARTVANDDVLCVPPDAGVAELCSVLGAPLADGCGGCELRNHCAGPSVAVALSPRERQVAVRVARGMSSKQIAAVLGIGLRTVNTYRESLARKLGASSPAVVTRYVLENRLDSTS